jgi:hypothetical protein
LERFSFLLIRGISLPSFSMYTLFIVFPNMLLVPSLQVIYLRLVQLESVAWEVIVREEPNALINLWQSMGECLWYLLL